MSSASILVWSTLAILSVWMLVPVDGRAQVQASTATEPRFEVASVKPSSPTPGPQGIQTQPGGRLTASRVTLRALVLRAFGIRDFQLEGGPDWMATDRFDINARAENGATEAELNAMLRALLIERFALKARTETRQLPVHVLRVARSDGRLGPWIRPTSAACQADLEDRRRTGAPPPPPGPPQATPEATYERLRMPQCGLTTVSQRPGQGLMFAMSATPVTTIIARLSNDLKAPVVDRTGLTGLFDFSLEHEAALPALRPNPLESPASTEPSFPPLRVAVEQQLGLKLETETGPVTILVVDAAAQPTPD